MGSGIRDAESVYEFRRKDNAASKIGAMWRGRKERGGNFGGQDYTMGALIRRLRQQRNRDYSGAAVRFEGLLAFPYGPF